MANIISIKLYDYIDSARKFEFRLTDENMNQYRYEYRIYNYDNYYFGDCICYNNSIIFKILGIKDQNIFVENIIGDNFKHVLNPYFPEIYGLDNFKKVLHALQNYLEL